MRLAANCQFPYQPELADENSYRCESLNIKMLFLHYANKSSKRSSSSWKWDLFCGAIWDEFWNTKVREDFICCVRIIMGNTDESQGKILVDLSSLGPTKSAPTETSRRLSTQSFIALWYLLKTWRKVEPRRPFARYTRSKTLGFEHGRIQ